MAPCRELSTGEKSPVPPEHPPVLLLVLLTLCPGAAAAPALPTKDPEQAQEGAWPCPGAAVARNEGGLERAELELRLDRAKE